MASLFKNLKVKLLALSILAMIPMTIQIFAYVLPIFKGQLLEEKKGEIRTAVDLLALAISEVEHEVEQKLIDEQTGEAMAKALVRTMKFNDGEDYFFAYDKSGVVIAHGLKPAIEGKNLIDSEDPKGTKFIRNILAEAEPGASGFTSYMYEKEKGGPLFDKVAAVKLLPKFGWVIGTGVYTDTIDEHLASVREMVIWGVIGALVFSLIVNLLISNSIAKKLLSISHQLSDGAEKMAEVASTITDASESLSHSTSAQAAALQETSASLEETSSTISRNAENATSSMTAVDQAHTSAEKGKTIVANMMRSMDEIKRCNDQVMNQVAQNNAEIGEIVKIIAEIEAKTNVINDIVFQTKLLSFNASVEAARAGEQGKGFAVVAEEVGNLARMSGTSAKEISDLLAKSVKKVEETIIQSTSRVQGSINEAKSRVEDGVATASECDAVLQDIGGHVSRVQQMMSEITTASKEQSQGVNEINKAVSEMDGLSQTNSAAAQKTHGSAEDLSEQVVALRRSASDLFETVSGKKAA